MDSFMKLKSDFEGLIGKIKIPGADGQVSDLNDEILIIII